MEQESYTVEQASQHALEWCKKHKGWKRICDIEDSDSLYKTWEELPKATRKVWEMGFPYVAESAWEEFGDKPCKVPFGFISGKGEFYKKATDVPLYHNLMMIFKVN